MTATLEVALLVLHLERSRGGYISRGDVGWVTREARIEHTGQVGRRLTAYGRLRKDATAYSEQGGVLHRGSSDNTLAINEELLGRLEVLLVLLLMLVLLLCVDGRRGMTVEAHAA